MKLVHIPSGEFLMGSPETEKDREPNEGPQHKVIITKAFYMGSTEVTQAQWKTVMESHHSTFTGDQLPVETVSFAQCQKFINKLSAKEGKAYRLPTEAEWEYACRAGSTARFAFGDRDEDLKDYAWFGAFKMYPVAQKKANAWGLYDMHGNVWEFCQDWYDEN
ncbi:MAG: formylglycine-generating enzyme family protein [Planctomycetota bacterium]